MLVMFTGPECDQCERDAPVLEEAAKLLEAEGWPGACAKLDWQNGASRQLLKKLRVRDWPTHMLFLDGIRFDQFNPDLVGNPSPTSLVDFLLPYLAPPPNMYSTLGVAPVSRPFSSWNRSILTEIYLCHACSCQEILRTKTAGQDADFKTIKKAFRKISRTLHPDKAPDGKGDQARFALVAGAYETLSDPDKRSMYDAFGSVTRFQVPGMQRTYIAAKGIQLKVYEDEDAAVKAWTKRQFMKRNTEDTYIVDFFAPVRSLARDELTEVFPTA
jgi:thiol-disulfide isomerase/thioredoxin